jgi:N-acetyl-anhydromuramyl-L-alanine amidase AmpD
MPDVVPSGIVEVRLTEAHAGVRPQTRGIVLHSTRGPTRPSVGEGLISVIEREYAVAVRYMLNPANEVSPHFCVGHSRVARMVPDELIAWHAQEHNQTHLGIEIAQPAYCPDFTDEQYRLVAEICARWCLKYRLPAVRVMSVDKPGIIGHEDTTQGKRDHKSDPGAKWEWPRFIQLSQARVDELVRGEGAYAMAGPGIQTFLRGHPEYGVPGKQYWDPHGNEVVITLGSTVHPHGVFVIWRKWLDKIAVASWDRPSP